MPLPSYPQLRKERDQLLAMVTTLSTDPNYGLTTRPAIEFELRSLRETPRFVVFLDIDDCHGANAQFGYEAVNQKVKRACKVRHADVLIRARWFSGDELVFILSGDPEGFIDRLRTTFKNQGLGFTAHHTPYTGDLEADVRACAAVVAAHKTGHRV